MGGIQWPIYMQISTFYIEKRKKYNHVFYFIYLFFPTITCYNMQINGFALGEIQAAGKYCESEINQSIYCPPQLMFVHLLVCLYVSKVTQEVMNRF